MDNFLFDVEQSKVSYVLKSLVLILIIAIPVAELVLFLIPHATLPNWDLGSPVFIFSAILLGPAIETLLMLLIFKVISYFTSKLITSCVISALVWAALHSMINVPIHGIVIFPSFLIYSIAFKVWDEVSRESALLITASIHMLNNMAVFFL